ncbi:unnamed protein product [Oncorhynchus mykiss]|uniref:Uncharacterized protein n=1 Tax=Oncorhynchus mykiss TaxID=8022 RepID=A0A060WDA0_ONCMY|nr:unnamed protein product [Oncorhynchus mykiss]
MRNSQGSFVIQDYGLVSFVPLNVQDRESMTQVLWTVDKANGCCFGDLEERNLACNDVSHCGSRLSVHLNSRSAREVCWRWPKVSDLQSEIITLRRWRPRDLRKLSPLRRHLTHSCVRIITENSE